MKNFYLVFFAGILLPLGLVAQETDSLSVNTVDNRYVEDQFYIGITYNVLTNKPAGVSQNNVSYGVFLGFIKDLPLNKRRNVALGIGAGYAMDSYFSNLRVIEGSDSNTYQILDNVDFRRNKIGTHSLEIPLEFRWRTSTADHYRFWRVYAGAKLGYVFLNNSKFVSDTERIKFTNDDIRKVNYSVFMSFGYNTWNFYASYQLTSVFEDDIYTDQNVQIDLQPLKLGLIFYIL